MKTAARIPLVVGETYRLSPPENATGIIYTHFIVRLVSIYSDGTATVCYASEPERQFDVSASRIRNY